MQTLSVEQQYAFHRFKCGDNLFITGAGGTGKSKLIQYIVDDANRNGKSVQVCALTGCAAVILKCNARTIHSWSGIRLAKGPKQPIIDSVLMNKRGLITWRTTQILIIDEVSMMSKKIFELLLDLGKQTRRNNLIFGGIQVIFTGDFFQLPPVGTIHDTDTDAFCFESPMWSQLFPINNCIELTTIFRQTDPIYKHILLQVRKGIVDEHCKTRLQECVGKPIDMQKTMGVVPTKLYPTRVKTDFVNTSMFSKLPGPEYIYKFTQSSNNVIFHNDCGGGATKPIPTEKLVLGSKLTASEIEHETQNLIQNTNCIQILRIKKNAIVMCTSNIDMDNGICNGSQGIVIDVKKNALNVEEPVVRFTNGQIRVIHPVIHQSEEYPTISVSQYPICLAWAMTIHKIQGASLAYAEIDIGNTVFEYGQSYVALSRVESLDGLHLSGFNAQKIRANPIVTEFYEQFADKNYEELLIDLLLTVSESSDKLKGELKGEETTRRIRL